MMYYILISMGIDPKNLPALMKNNARPDTLKRLWSRDKQTRMMMMGGAAFVAMIVLVAAALGGTQIAAQEDDMEDY
ncbi:MAG: hypothetical protein QCI38_02430, partial [Candidatus Thermoplasmatota archaeon]|nr:hypothetical protein [Candidatus Thermoplasmatota archaeon]